MTTDAIYLALQQVSAADVARAAGCTRQAVNDCRRFGRIADTDKGRKIAEAMARLCDGAVTVEALMERSEDDRPIRMRSEPAALDRKLQGEKKRATDQETRQLRRRRQTMREKVQGQVDAATKDLDWQDDAVIAEVQRRAITEKNIADARLAEEKYKQAKMQNARDLGQLVPLEEVKRCLEQAGAAFRRSGEVATRQIEGVVCDDCRPDVAAVIKRYTEAMRQDVMKALRGG